MTKRHLLILSAAALVVSACATSPLSPPSGDQWRLQGRIGYWADGVQESGNIDWTYCSQTEGKLRLTGPLGVGGIEIRIDGGRATFKHGDETLSAETADELAATAGWPVPVSALQYWVRGRAAADAPLKGQLDSHGRLTELQQLGWQIHYGAYDAQQPALPVKIEARRSPERIKLLIRDWAAADCSQ